MKSYYFFIPLLSFALSIMLIKVLRKIALKVNFVDAPNERKIQKDPIPIIGGIAVIIASSISLLIVPQFWEFINKYYVLIIGSFILLTVGVIDDKLNIRPLLKLIIQIAIAHFVFDSGIRLESMFGIFGIYAMPISVQYFMTIFVIVGVINAFNLMDGIDGLAAGLALSGLVIFTIVAYSLNLDFLIIYFIALIGALCAFLKFNLSKRKKVYMGDAGALVIGFLLVVSGIILIQSANGTAHIKSTLAIVIGVLALPVADSLRVYRKRIKSGISPFKADRTHFHHLVLVLGVNHKIASLYIVLLSLGIVMLILLFGMYYSLTLSIIIILFLFIFIANILSLYQKLNLWKAKVKKMENR